MSIINTTPLLENASSLDNLELGEINLLTGSAVFDLVVDQMFLKQWDELYSACPWATIFQTHDFVIPWYEHYANQYNPILVLSQIEGKLTGIMPLARGINELGIAGAGGYDAYYHVWLSAPRHGEEFIEAAIKKLMIEFPGQDITLKYIPQNVPMNWVSQDNWKKYCVLRYFRRPLLNLANLEREQVFSKKSFKERYKSLRKLGEVKFELITDPAAFDSILDHLADQYDFRKASTFNIMPFRDDPQKKHFLLDLLHKAVLVLAVLKVNGNIISGITTTTERAGWSHGAGINTHAPAYSRYSPGYLIMKFLSVALKEASVTMFDITPGGHTYKDSHASEHDTLIELRITNTYNALYLRKFYKAKEFLKNNMQKRGVDAREIKKVIGNRLVLLKDKLLLFRNIPWTKTPLINSSAKVTHIIPYDPMQPAIPEIKKDCLKDILLFNPNGSGVTRWEFMKRAMKHYEAGYIPYTYSEINQLLCLVWLAPQHLKGREINEEVVKSLPPDSAILCNIYSHPKATEKFTPFINGVANKLLALSPNNTIYLVENIDFHPK